MIKISHDVRRAILAWMAAFPTITVLLFLLRPLMHGWPLVIQTMILTLIMVPLLNFIVMPRLASVFRQWLTEPAKDAASMSISQS